MYDANDLVKLIKRMATEAVNAAKPSNMVFGTVISEDPLKIKVDQKMILTTAQLVLSRNVTDFEVEIEPSENEEPSSHFTENASGGSGDAAFASHKHEIKGKKKFLVYNHLKTDDEVILFQIAGGQKFVVLDRIGKG